MILYISKDKSVVFLINFKACYSTFETLKKNNVIYTNNDINDDIFKNIPIYLITRDPIKRFVSFYKDKIINQLKNLKRFDQYCHKEFLKFYSEEFIKSDKFNIDSVLNALEKGNYNDAHLRHQNNNYHEIKKINKNIKIIKMEDEHFEDKICKLLNINELPKCNTTSHIQNIELSNEQINRLKKIYQDDYKEFNY